MPETDATKLLRAIDVRPAQQIELASIPLTTIEAAIADGQARQGIRDLAGWVVYLLRQRRDHGWTPPPPAPRPDAPEVLGTYFAQLAAEQDAGREGEQAKECTVAATSTPAPPLPPTKGEQRPSLADLWQRTLATLRLRLPREIYQACVRQTRLLDYSDGVATIGVSHTRLKETLTYSHSDALRVTVGDALGRDVRVRIVMHMPT